MFPLFSMNDCCWCLCTQGVKIITASGRRLLLSILVLYVIMRLWAPYIIETMKKTKSSSNLLCSWWWPSTHSGHLMYLTPSWLSRHRSWVWQSQLIRHYNPRQDKKNHNLARTEPWTNEYVCDTAMCVSCNCALYFDWIWSESKSDSSCLSWKLI